MTDEKVLTERAELAVAELHASGVIFGVISARPPRGLLMLRGQLQITTPVIGFNLVTIASNEFLETDRYQIPTGQWISVAGTAFDFKAPRGIGERIREPTARLEYGGGYDHYFVLSEEKSPRATRLAARIVDQISGRVLEFLATQPGLQFYMGNELNSKVRGRSGLIANREDLRSSLTAFRTQQTNLTFHRSYCIQRRSTKKGRSIGFWSLNDPDDHRQELVAGSAVP